MGTKKLWGLKMHWFLREFLVFPHTEEVYGFYKVLEGY